MLKQVFITKKQMDYIVKNLDDKDKDQNGYEFGIYRKLILLELFNKLERKGLLNFWLFCSNPNLFTQSYRKRKWNPQEAGKYYVYHTVQPRYHLYQDCVKMKSSFQNYEIPRELAEQGEEKIEEFRKWFKSQIQQDNPNYDQMNNELSKKFSINYKIKDLKVTRDNTGHTHFNNYDLNALESKLDQLIGKCEEFYELHNTPDNFFILQFLDQTYKSYKDGIIISHKSEEFNENLKSKLREFDQEYKQPLIELLKQYYMVKFNPELKFEGHLLDQLGFTVCQTCQHQYLSETGGIKKIQM